MVKTGVVIKDSIEKSTLIYLPPSHIQFAFTGYNFMKYVGKGHICSHATKIRNVSYRASQSLTTYMHMYPGLNPELIIHFTYM